MATPAEVANDMDAHARYWDGRDARIAHACRDAGKLIRDLLAGERVEGRRYWGLHGRLHRLQDYRTRLKGRPNLDRAANTLSALWAETQR